MRLNLSNSFCCAACGTICSATGGLTALLIVPAFVDEFYLVMGALGAALGSVGGWYLFVERRVGEGFELPTKQPAAI